MREIAQRLIEYETPRADSSKTKSIAPFRATERLRPHLATLMGNGGFRALLARALTLASAKVTWLRAVRVNPDGALEGLEQLQARLEPADFLEGRVVLLAQLLGLLVAMIGPGLTLRLVGEVWPQLSADNMNFGDGDRK